MPQEEESARIEQLVRHNNELIEENNKLLKRMNRFMLIGATMRFVWYGLLIGLPFALYFYVIEPYFSAFGSSYETFMLGLNELPGLKGINEVLNAVYPKE